MGEQAPRTDQDPREEAVKTVASALHEDWRKTRLQEDGTFEPRIKPTKDEAWTAAHDGATEVDIANTSFEDLPSDWQAENQVAAGVVVDILQSANGQVDLTDEEQRNAVGDTIHSAWLARNNWAAGGELDVPFAQLPPVEQAKDIDQMVIAQQVFQQ